MNKPAPISGYRSRAINGVADFAASVAPVAGPGASVVEGPGGRVVSFNGRTVPQRPAAWTVRALPMPGDSDPATVQWVLYIWAGLVKLNGAELPAPSEDGTDEATGLNYYYMSFSGRPVDADWICVCYDETDGSGEWSIGWRSSPFQPPSSTTRWHAIAHVLDDGPPPKYVQLEAGVIDLGRDGPLMPFDIVLRPTNGHYAVYLGPADALVINNDDTYTYTYCDAVTDADGYVDLGATATAAWLYVRVVQSSGGYPEYHWGVLAAAPSSSARYIAVWQIGAISASGEISQYWHGRIRIADADPDGRSIERNDDRDGWYGLQLRNFAAGATAALNIFSVDYVVRKEDGSDYLVDYISGADIQNQLEIMIQYFINQFLADLLDPSTHPGGQFKAWLDGMYQPIVSTSTTTDGTDSGEYHGIAPDSNGKTWSPA